mmetsp:Transcript_107719/g.303460  ORF Transcript_107719/g.303460 Transcript_107719/m.303460 type:complete len:207 (+) Transcript_107719:556-1176(+)
MGNPPARSGTEWKSCPTPTASKVMTASAVMAPTNVSTFWFWLEPCVPPAAKMAAMKKVLSPISETKVRRNACTIASAGLIATPSATLPAAAACEASIAAARPSHEPAPAAATRAGTTAVAAAVSCEHSWWERTAGPTQSRRRAPACGKNANGFQPCNHRHATSSTAPRTTLAARHPGGRRGLARDVVVPPPLRGPPRRSVMRLPVS